VIIASKRENVHYGKEQMHLRVTCIFLQAEAICVRSVSVQWRRLHGARGARAPPQLSLRTGAPHFQIRSGATVSVRVKAAHLSRPTVCGVLYRPKFSQL